jgi:hypothetical protein
LVWRKLSYPLMRYQCIQDKKLNWYGDIFMLNTSSTMWHQWGRMPNKKMKQQFYQKWSWLAWSGQRRSIGACQFTGSPIRNRSSPCLMMCSGVSDATSIFIRTRGPLKIKDQIGKTAYKDVRSNKQYMKSLIITLE